jgi:hypothetical protein
MSGFTLVPSPSTSSGPSLAQIQAEVNAASSPFNLPIVTHDTVLSTPAWVKAKLPKGTKTTYSVLQANCYQPPAWTHTNPLALTDAQIALYGFQPRKYYRDEMPQWVNLVKHALHRSCLGTFTNQINGSLKGSAARSSRVARRALNEHDYPIGWGTTLWSGWGMEQASDGTAWAQAEGYWYQPSAPTTVGRDGTSQTCWNRSDFCHALGEASWTGLDGFQDPTKGGVVQQGVTIDASPYGVNTYTLSYVAWVENTWCFSHGCDGYQEDLSIGTISAGDEMYADTIADSGGHPLMTVQDMQTGNYASKNYGPTTAGYTFECIMENAGDLGQVNPMQMHSEQWTQCDGKDTNGYHHAIASSNSYAYYKIYFTGENIANTEQYPSNACGAGCGDGGFYIYSQADQSGTNDCGNAGC